MVNEQDWISAHIFYHGELDEVLIHAVHPLVRQLAADNLAEGFFFLRYWDGGPHLRLRVLAGPDQQEAVRQRIEQHSADLFWHHPAPDRYDPREYPAWARRLAALEGVQDYCRQPYPNNSLAFIPYRREHGRYGRGESMAVVERHFVESSTIALALVARRTVAGERRLAALAMLLLAWFCAPPAAGLPRAARGGSGSAADEEAYQRQRDTLHRLAERLRALPTDPPAGRSGALAAWAASVARLRDALAEAGTADADRSRIVDLCAHLGCNRVGLSPEGERHVRYLAARTMGALTGPAPAPTTASP